MTKKTPGVGIYGKFRIPTIGHLAAIDTAKEVATNSGAKLHIAASKASYIQAAKRIFLHPIETNHKDVVDFLAHMSQIHHEFTLVCGSDRAKEYTKILAKYNGNEDKKGKIPFSFDRWDVFEVAGSRLDTTKSPLHMSKDELIRSVSSTKIEQLVIENRYKEFCAYYPDMSDKEAAKYFKQIQRKAR